MTRLERLAPALRARERFLMALRDYREGRTTQPVAGEMDKADWPEYDRCVRLALALNERLGAFCWMLLHQATWMEDDLQTVLVLEEGAETLQHDHSFPREKPPRDWRKRELPIPTFLRGLALDRRGRSLSASTSFARTWRRPGSRL